MTRPHNETATAPRLRIGGDLTPSLLPPAGNGSGRNWLGELLEAATGAGLDRVADLCSSGSPDAARLGAVMALSPYLRSSLLWRPSVLDALLDEDAGDRLGTVVGALDSLPDADMPESALMKRLREIKREASLLIALRDLFGAASPAQTARDLSRLAEGAIRAALRFCLRSAHDAKKLKLPDASDPEDGCGLFVLAMGKLGARELNYSSDVDLIVFFDADIEIACDPMEAVVEHSKVVRRLVRILSERTGDGYVFRTDLRLRPDPGAMPLAITTDMGMTYYESSGRNWERAAMIKASVVAGDRKAGEAFLAELAPFVWRKYLDFAAIADIHDMKGRIDRHRGFGEITLPGHNVKLGRGGIREIEFFAQTQQLIAGGRNPALRTRRTDEALDRLAAFEWIEDGERDDLLDAYWFLRQVEHAIQMVDDEQTHDLPEDEEGLSRIAGLLGLGSREAFEERLLGVLRLVDHRFNDLFNEGRSRQAGEGDAPDPVLRLLNNDADPEGIKAIAELGFERPEDVARVVRIWSFGRYRSTRTAKARERLSDVLPSLLKAFADAPDPDGAVAAFDGFLSGLPSGIQFFSLIASNPKTLDLLLLILTAAPVMRATLAQRPHVFDALLDPAFFDEVPDRELMEERLGAFLADADGYEDVLARLRIFASEQRFLVGARMLSGVVDLNEAGPAFSNIADVVLNALLIAVVAEFSRAHGRVAGMRLVLLGMGRLGSRELTAASDLDLILLYDHEEEAETSDGGKPLAIQVYFTRLTQRLIAALTSPMREGALYEVDFRLRPSGNAGPLATRFKTFRKYQENEAWVWERMALTRARPIAGDADLRQTVFETIEELLGQPMDEEEVRDAVVSMRGRIARDKPARGELDLKLRPGGLVDLEFIAQWAQLTGRAPGEPGRETADVLRSLRSRDGGEEIEGVSEKLARSMEMLSAVTHLSRLAPGGVQDVSALPTRLTERIADALDLDDAGEFADALERITGTVRDCFVRHLGDPDEARPTDR
ncbi:bifunctional [glutamine synthetase] adenylyltransferase/[glutamine synthetase]-adenylyl-L-tyrosine phosphorylase [Fulvimarina endophytica]|uniref:Bifunctional glutamine synthetase adenylyltransferase/adenylyl-removing enzyme n=1 Tax=Fulvimarina endophytica TaxID=2293836 RepID=A0A371X882_9HYPH|nr:bifunctional [glutamine synthetase] adenylyltransferase/[glutamine synthetase]-adenylyl-L-tyrosine phosphorylase [Fulvimarina endophytica]RFC65427.1 bifunctional [glutamine synthetase] adenylyltransferase/[glutamine synthetase]-adenylyl-L-tyrosine phosphorylase [Fulvimarina endophytica]